MKGIGDREYLAIRLESYASEVLRSRVHPLRHPLELSVHQTRHRLSPAEAENQTFTRAEPGFRWGPVWSTAWFRIRGKIPRPMAGQKVALRFSSGTEALIWRDGEPQQGLDDHRDRWNLPGPAKEGAPVDVLVEAACNQPLGISTFWWDHPEIRRRWTEDRPGRVECCELVTVDEQAWRVWQKFEFLRQLALSLPENSTRSWKLLDRLGEMVERCRGVDQSVTTQAGPEQDWSEEEAHLDHGIVGHSEDARSLCIAVGHAHLDTAWLWPIAETRRKILRSWSNALALMEEFPGFHFVASQAQQYAYLEEDHPGLFRRIQQAVVEGRFEPVGAMWVEPDCHGPSGESLVRQVLLGRQYFESRFESHPSQRVMYLPDTFGFPASLPQIARLAGFDTFVTNKMSWCERNDFPFVTFRWRGIDGTELLSHFTPGDNYNSPLLPHDLVAGEAQLLRKDHQFVGRISSGLKQWLQPYGYGDGGGGPDRECAMRAQLARQSPGLPAVRQRTMAAFARDLHAERQELLDRGEPDVPVWDGELYLELHRGTFTSQGWLKQANRELEEDLRLVEMLMCLAPGEHEADAQAVRQVWRKLLLHQFHDILPGTSIGVVYEEAKREFEAMGDRVDRLRDSLLAKIASHAGHAPSHAGAWVLNPSSHARSEWVCHEDQWHRVTLGPMQSTFLSVDEPSEPAPAVRVTERTLNNEHLTVALNDAGWIVQLDRSKNAPASKASADQNSEAGSLRLHRLVAYEDRPRRWEAWDLDFDTMVRPLEGLEENVQFRVLESGPHRGVLEVRRRFRSSEIVQRHVLKAGSRRLDIETFVDWREDQVLLRAQFETRVRSRFATFGIAFGALERPTHRNTSWEEARFEVPGQRWMDLSQPGSGLAVLDDGKYGRSAEGNVLGLSLVRSPKFPDPNSDREEHRFTYSLYPHEGDWRRADVPAEADELRQPLLAVSVSKDAQRGGQPPSIDWFRAESLKGAMPEFASMKPAESGTGWVLRMVERHGGSAAVRLNWKRPVNAVSRVNLMEQLPERIPVSRPEESSAADEGLPAEYGECSLHLQPYQILTLLVTPGPADS